MAFFAPRDFKDPSKWDLIATTPRAITPEILKLCGRLTAKWGEDGRLSALPVFVPVQTVFDKAKISNCYLCVKDVNLPGARIVHGFLIWEEPGIYLNAEHHALLQLPDGSLVDVTPPMAGERKVCFLPVAYKEEHEKGGVRSEFEGLTEHPLIQQVILFKYQLDALMWESKAHTQQYKSIDDNVCRNIMRYRQLLKERAAKNKLREKKRKKRK